MAKYIAKEDIPPYVKAGDTVEAENELIPEYKAILEPVEAAEEKVVTTQISRDALKARATQLGITFASNIPTEKLMELIGEAEKTEKESSSTDEGENDENEE